MKHVCQEQVAQGSLLGARLASALYWPSSSLHCLPHTTHELSRSINANKLCDHLSHSPFLSYIVQPPLESCESLVRHVAVFFF